MLGLFHSLFNQCHTNPKFYPDEGLGINLRLPKPCPQVDLQQQAVLIRTPKYFSFAKQASLKWFQESFALNFQTHLRVRKQGPVL
jgi:hypothetical protein